MQGETKVPWRQLAEQAANERDLSKLLELVDEISRLLEAKENWLNEKAKGVS
jgi:hypothetical protein